MKEKRNVWLPIVLMLAFALTRWPGVIPAEWVNFSAAYGLLFCAGVYLPGASAWWLPIGTLFLSNTLLNLFVYHQPVFNWYMVIIYGAYALVIFLGRRYDPRTLWLKLVGGGLLGAILFYVVSNTAAWLYEPTQPYPKNLAGWWQALTVGTSGWPETWKFFRNTLLSSGIFTGLFVGSMKYSERIEEAREKESDEEATEQPENAEPESQAGRP